MAGQAHGKDASLAESRTLNPHPEAVTDPAFTAGAFFDPADLVQVKYEMVRAVEAGGLGAGAAASAFGLARQSYYNARKALAEHGLPGLIPARPGPKGGHKLTSAVVDFLEQHPEVSMHVELSDRSVDLIEEGYDLGIRTALPGGAGLAGWVSAE